MRIPAKRPGTMLRRLLFFTLAAVAAATTARGAETQSLRLASVTDDSLRQALDGRTDWTAIALFAGRLTRPSIEALAACEGLRTLHLGSVAIDPGQFAPLAALRQLESLTVLVPRPDGPAPENDRRFGDGDLLALTASPALRSLNINLPYGRFTEAGLARLPECAGLRGVLLRADPGSSRVNPGAPLPSPWPPEILSALAGCAGLQILEVRARAETS